MKQEITRFRLCEILDYDQESGEFLWKRTSGRAVCGCPAGTIDKEGYIVIQCDKRIYKAHRLAFLWMIGSFPEHDVDHINGDKSDNSWRNLRPATRSENCANRRPIAGAKSKFIGVGRRGDTGKWVSKIKVKGKTKHLGYHDTEKAAAIAYDEAARQYHGEFARLNFTSTNP